jgi:hypothetical protein
MDRYKKITDSACSFLEKLQPAIWMEFSQRLRCIPGPERNPVPWAAVQDFFIEASPADYLPLSQAGETQEDHLQNLIQNFVANETNITCSTDEILNCLKQEKIDISILADDRFGTLDLQKVIGILCVGDCFQLKQAAKQQLLCC